jgi:hypothetical protein
MCPFPNMCTVAFQPGVKQHGYGYYSATGPMTPVERLAINLGASGDRRDAAGRLWLGYPRPGGSLVLQFPLEVSFTPGGGFVQRNANFTPVAGTPDPWLFASAARGLAKLSVKVLEPADGQGRYRVRLYFADPDNDSPGQRVFDVKIQGTTVLDDFDPAAAAGGRDKAVVREFGGIESEGSILVEMIPAGPKPAPQAAPILQAVEVVREQMLTLGCRVPDLQLSTLEPKRSAELQLANLRGEPFSGTLHVVLPAGFAASPAEVPVSLAPGGRTKVAVEVSLTGEAAVGVLPYRVVLRRPDGSTDLEREAKLENLGHRGRLVLPPIEDSYVQKRYPTLNKGTATVLLVDGGRVAMGDEDHAVAYLKYRLDVPGKVLAVRLRIHNAGNESGEAGRVCLVEQPWSETELTYAKRPAVGKEVARLGGVSANQAVERPLGIDLAGLKELSLAIDPTSADGVDYLSRESGSPPELIIEYEPEQ